MKEHVIYRHLDFVMSIQNVKCIKYPEDGMGSRISLLSILYFLQIFDFELLATEKETMRKMDRNYRYFTFPKWVISMSNRMSQQNNLEF